MSVYPGVIVMWCIEARVKSRGKPHRHETMGDAQTATDAMAAWLEQFADEPGSPRIDIKTELTSEQLPGWVHKTGSEVAGMPAEEAVEYSVNWLKNEAKMKNWGSGP